MTGKELPASNIADLQSLLRRREISPREVLDVLRARIEDVDGEIDAYLSTDFEAQKKQMSIFCSAAFRLRSKT